MKQKAFSPGLHSSSPPPCVNRTRKSANKEAVYKGLLRIGSNVYIYSFGPWRGVHLLLWTMERCTFTPLEHGEVYIYSFGTWRGVHLLLWNMEWCTFTPLEHGEVYIYSFGTWKGSTLCIDCSYLHLHKSQVRQTVCSSKSLTCHVGHQNLCLCRSR